MVLALLRIYFACLFSVLGRVCVWHGMLVDLREQFSGTGSHLPPCCGGVFLVSAATLSNSWVAGPKLLPDSPASVSHNHRRARISRFAALHQLFIWLPELCAFTGDAVSPTPGKVCTSQQVVLGPIVILGRLCYQKSNNKVESDVPTLFCRFQITRRTRCWVQDALEENKEDC